MAIVLEVAISLPPVRIDHVCAYAPARLTTIRRHTYLRPAKEGVLAELLPVRPLPVLLRREEVESPSSLAVLFMHRDQLHTLLHGEHEVGQPLAEPVASPRRCHEGVAVGVREGIERPLCYEGRVGLGWGFILFTFVINTNIMKIWYCIRFLLISFFREMRYRHNRRRPARQRSHKATQPPANA